MVHVSVFILVEYLKPEVMIHSHDITFSNTFLTYFVVKISVKVLLKTLGIIM